MASPETPEKECKYGYRCTFKDAVISDLFKCSSCNLVAKELSIISCCGEHFCQPHLKQLREEKKNCPKCDNRDFTDMPSKKIQNEILKLAVFCIMKERGCDWEGQVRDLDEHEGSCEHVIVKCPKECGLVQIKRGKLAEHLEAECPKREYSCPHCNFKDTYSFVMNAHMPLCSFCPVKCPNQCGVEGERDDMETHTQDFCPKQYINCTLSFAGCKEKFRREDKEKHMDENSQQHFDLLAKAAEVMSEEIKELKSDNMEKKQLGKDVDVERTVEEGGRKVEEMGKKVEELIVRQQSQSEQNGEEMTILRDKLAVERERVDDLEKQVNNIKINEDISPPEQQGENEKRLEMELKLKDEKIEQLTKTLEEYKRAFNKHKRAFEERKVEFEAYKRASNDLNLQLENRLAKLEQHFNNAQAIDHTPPPPHIEPPNLPLITLEHFSRLKEKNERWSSPSFTACDGGPTLTLEVWPNGQQDGRGTHVSVWFEQKIDDFEDFNFVTIGLKLLSNTSNHIADAQTFPNTNQRYIGAFNKFIAHSELENFLKNDCLSFQFTKVQSF